MLRLIEIARNKRNPLHIRTTGQDLQTGSLGYFAKIIFFVSTQSPACNLYKYKPLGKPSGRHEIAYSPADCFSCTSVASSCPRTLKIFSVTNPACGNA